MDNSLNGCRSLAANIVADRTGDAADKKRLRCAIVAVTGVTAHHYHTKHSEFFRFLFFQTSNNRILYYNTSYTQCNHLIASARLNDFLDVKMNGRCLSDSQ